MDEGLYSQIAFGVGTVTFVTFFWPQRSILALIFAANLRR
jgi:hypothetical protein